MGNGDFAGYPLPALVPVEVRGDPDEENPNELVLDGSQVNPGLPPLDLLTGRGGADEGGVGGEAETEDETDEG